jgi:hypothetical protein
VTVKERGVEMLLISMVAAGVGAELGVLVAWLIR